MKRSLNIGLNYAGTNYELGGCENDAFDLRKRMRLANSGHSIDQFQIFTGGYSAAALFNHLEHFRLTCKKSDTTYFTFSGHGTQIPGSESDGYEEGICLFNHGRIEVVRDSDLSTALAQIPGNVIAIFDSCFSGGMSREVQKPDTRRKFMPFDAGTMMIHRQAHEKTARPILANKTYYLYACAESEVSYDLGMNGLFTKALCQYYDYLPAKERTIKGLISRTRSTCEPNQSPYYECFGGSGAKRIF